MMHIHHQWQWQFSHQNGLFLPKKSNHFFHDLVGTVSNDLAVIKGAAMPLTLTEKKKPSFYNPASTKAWMVQDSYQETVRLLTI